MDNDPLFLVCPTCHVYIPVKAPQATSWLDTHMFCGVTHTTRSYLLPRTPAEPTYCVVSEAPDNCTCELSALELFVFSCAPEVSL